MHMHTHNAEADNSYTYVPHNGVLNLFRSRRIAVHMYALYLLVANPHCFLPCFVNQLLHCMHVCINANCYSTLYFVFEYSNNCTIRYMHNQSLLFKTGLYYVNLIDTYDDVQKIFQEFE